MRRLPGPTVALFPLLILVACAGAPPAAPASTPEEDRHAVEALKREFTSERARTASRCDAADPEETKKHVKAEVWGKDDGPPGLPAMQVEAFLCRQRRELESACWHPKFADWERSEIEYGLVVDPSGAVLTDDRRSADEAATAALERGSTRVESSELAHCVENVVDAWTFPRATMPTWMRLTFRVPD
jgi:hypothetical protein